MITNNRTSPVVDPDPPSPLFHASSAVLNVGDVVVPGIELGVSRGQFVWMDNSPSGNLFGPLLYEVVPVGDVEATRADTGGRDVRSSLVSSLRW